MKRHTERYVEDAARAAEKQAARDEDARDVAEGRKTAAQVNRDNSLAHGLIHELVMRLRPGVRCARAGSVDQLVTEPTDPES